MTIEEAHKELLAGMARPSADSLYRILLRVAEHYQQVGFADGYNKAVATWQEWLPVREAREWIIERIRGSDTVLEAKAEATQQPPFKTKGEFYTACWAKFLWSTSQVQARLGKPAEEITDLEAAWKELVALKEAK